MLFDNEHFKKLVSSQPVHYHGLLVWHLSWLAFVVKFYVMNTQHESSKANIIKATFFLVLLLSIGSIWIFRSSLNNSTIRKKSMVEIAYHSFDISEVGKVIFTHLSLR